MIRYCLRQRISLTNVRHYSNINKSADDFDIKSKISDIKNRIDSVKTDDATFSEDMSEDSGKSTEKLYFDKFTEKEYNNAAKYIKAQIDALEGEIKGTKNVRENLGKIQSYPERTNQSTVVNNLTDLFTQTIKTNGPISLSTYIRQCLTHPSFGYYTTRDPLDPLSGDFITSPEISSVFGEMIAIYLISIWKTQGKPKNIKLIEFGPGKGSLIFDVLQIFNKLISRDVSIEINLIESSPVLRKLQWSLLCGEKNTFVQQDHNYNTSKTIWNNTIHWYNNEKDINNDSSVANYVIAHEFFDALPIKAFERTENGWREFVVEHSPSVLKASLTEGSNDQIVKTTDKSFETEISKDDKTVNNDFQLNNDNHETARNMSSKSIAEHSINNNTAITNLSVGNAKSSENINELDTQFHLTLSPNESPSSILPTLSPRFAKLPVGSRIEICTEAELYMLKMLQLLNNDSKLGSVLVIDYGYANDFVENSLRGIHKHKFVSPFYRPGEVDLSIDVDFTALKILTDKHAQSFGPVDQGDWLHNIGIGYRIEQLISRTSNLEEQEKIYKAYKRLTENDEDSMGKIYKFFMALPKGSPSPPGC